MTKIAPLPIQINAPREYNDLSEPVKPKGGSPGASFALFSFKPHIFILGPGPGSLSRPGLFLEDNHD